MTPAGAPIRPNTFGVRSFPPSKMVKQYKLVC
jgi:hypothetical protein